MAKRKYIYQGAGAADVVLAPTGRAITVSTGDVVNLLANEAKSLSGSVDWIPAATTEDPKDGKSEK